jgi:hypothetical protein
MPRALVGQSAPSEVAILGRVLSNGGAGLSAAVARYLLSLDFPEADKARMLKLAAKNQKGKLSPKEKDELLGYARVGCLLGILHSRARKSLQDPK